ncbi:MAG: GNAT family N-acetyltransferase [Anaerocolumna sp.]
MEFKKEANRIYMENEKGEMLAEVTFPGVREAVVNINHTFVDDSLRGQGIASKLMEEVVKELEDSNRKAIPTCSYAVMWFEKNKQYSDLLSN